ncbi:MAG: T9SS type A sorting domain-containing protein [bacterium]
MIIFFIYQILIPDFQVNGEDYPGSEPQLHPAIACYDSGGVIIWYDLRCPANGMRVFGTMLNTYGDTIYKNFCLCDDTTTGCISIPAVANEPSGRFTVVWVQNQHLIARRFDKYGNALGPSFVVSNLSGSQYPAIAISPSGWSVITWFTSSDFRIYGQIYDPYGNPAGANFLVSDSSVTMYSTPDVAMKNNGDIIVAWSYNDDIWAQMFDSLGNRIGNNFKLINDTNNITETYPKLRFDQQNNLFVSWNAIIQDQKDINCQIFDSSLTPITGMIKIDGANLDTAQRQSIAVKDSIWYVVFQNGLNAVYFQRIKNNGELLGENIRVSAPGGRRINFPRISATQNFFIITWEKLFDGTICDIVCQKGSFDGNLVDSNYVVSDDKGGDPQYFPAIVADTMGNFFVVWDDFRRYPNYNFVPNQYGRRYDPNGNPLTDEFRINIPANAMYADIGLNSSVYVVVWARTQIDSNHQVYAQRFDYNCNPIGTHYQISQSIGTHELTFPKISTLSNEHFVVVWKENDGIRDKVYGRFLDATGLPYGNQFNPSIDSNAFNFAWKPIDEGDNRFIIPISCNIESLAIACQEFDYNGNPLSTPIILNDTPGSINYVCGAKGIRRYLFVWAANNRIIGQLLDHNLQKIGNNFIISEDTVAYKDFPAIVSDTNGNFFVIWSDTRNGNPDLYSQFFDSLGNKIDYNFRVDNDTTNSEQVYVNCFSANNQIYIVWSDTRTPTNWYDTYCKVIEWQGAQGIRKRQNANNGAFLKIYPNPFTETTNINFALQGDQKSAILLKIYDASGRLVKSFNPASIIVWFGEDNSGRRLPAGVYFVQLETETEEMIKKVVKIE